MIWRIEITPRAFAQIAASGIGRQLLRAIRQLEHGPNVVDLEIFPGRSRTWLMYPAEAPANEWRILFWLDPDGERVVWIYAVRSHPRAAPRS